MGIAFNNPVPLAEVDDILRPSADANPLMDRGQFGGEKRPRGVADDVKGTSVQAAFFDPGRLAWGVKRSIEVEAEKMALLGPMGYSGAAQSVIRITFAQLFPLKPIQESTFRWAFSDNPLLGDEFGEWFQLIMKV